ncbi:MAG: hypothetical protein KAS02_00960 [Candidatus Pacebacteria bacterium]|nr:hypothetical protein [Candidatus Paceibacterota bacterium]
MIDLFLSEKFTSQTLEMYSDRDVKIVWHDGESLLAGLHFFNTERNK